VAKLIRMALPFMIACIVNLGTLSVGRAANSGSEAGPGASAKVIACMTACEQTQMACLQGPAQIPPAQRTIKDINASRACNRAEEVCDHRCRRK
jgi:hypothetical protein